MSGWKTKFALGLTVVGLAACGNSGSTTASTAATQAAQPTVTPNAEPLESSHPNSIQPETTLSLSATGSLNVAPDIAFLNAGVSTEGATAEEAMKANATAMNGVFGALEKAGIDKRDMQTSNFSVQPRYNYSSSGKTPPKVSGYTASNQLSVKVSDLDSLGETIDALVGAGGNTFSGLRFALEDESAAMDEARGLAIREAIARAELYASSTGFDVARIVTISESGGASPQPIAMMQSRALTAAEATPIASGEVGYSVTVNVTFELRQ